MGYPCKEHYNPGDHYINEISIVEDKEEFSKHKIDQICKHHEESETMENINSNVFARRITTLEDTNVTRKIIDDYDNNHIGFLPSLYWLWWRASINQV